MFGSGSCIQCGDPFPFHLNAHLCSGNVRVHSSCVLRVCYRRSGRSDGRIPIHGRNPCLQIVRHALDALSLQNGGSHAGGNLPFSISQINATIQRPFCRIIRHQIRFVLDKPLDCLLVQQVEANVSGNALNGVCGIVAVQSIYTRRSVINVAYSRLIGFCVPFSHPLLECLKTLPTAYLIEPPLLVVTLRPFLAVYNGADKLFHFGVPLFKLPEIVVHRFLQFFCGFTINGSNAAFQLRKLFLCQIVAFIRFHSSPPGGSVGSLLLNLSKSSSALRFMISSTSSGVRNGRCFKMVSSSRYCAAVKIICVSSS